MSAVFAPRRRWIAVLAAAFVANAAPVWADTVSINVDEARVMKLPERVATIVIGNPLIADASLQTGGVLVLTGKSFGSTNLLALDRAGKVLMDQNVVVASPSAAANPGLVVVYKGIERESYSCSPECAPRIMLGDSNGYFGNVLQQSSTRTGGQGGGAPAAPAPR